MQKPDEYAAPIMTRTRKVPAEWIDYNGHMNVSYYGMAFDQAIDEVFEQVLGIGETHTKTSQHGPYVLQNNLHYIDEMLENAEFHVRFQLIDHDAKRLHLFLELINAKGQVAACSEQLLINVDLTTRRAAQYPDWIMERLAMLKVSHDKLAQPKQLAAPLGIRRKG